MAVSYAIHGDQASARDLRRMSAAALRGRAEVPKRTVEVFYMKGEEVAVRAIKPLAAAEKRSFCRDLRG